ncbi:MAG: phosphomannomutase [Gammaproteobacteria bacterium]|nr:phosphomannomutase [Gammaproteobacteria bacterium]
MTELVCFKAYDVRGRVPDELNEDVAYRIGRAYAATIRPRTVVVGHDIRLSSESIKAGLISGLLDSGSDVADIGLCGTEQIYHATFAGNYDGGIVVTASHNPKDYNGMKFVREAAKPVSGDTGLGDIKALAERNRFGPATVSRGICHQVDCSEQYVEHLLSYIDRGALAPLRIVVNAGNGGAGRVIDMLEPHLPFEFIKINHAADGNFPNGVPNPLLEENRAATSAAVKAGKAHLGIAWDGDFDRCFFFDERAHFIEGYYIVGMLAEVFLSKAHTEKSARIIHDPRLEWNTLDIVHQRGGTPVKCRIGHAFIKERMRLEDAIYGGEMSAHHYFRQFAYCDSGMIPWLLVAERLSKEDATLSQLVRERIAAYPVSGEINRHIADPAGAIGVIENALSKHAAGIDYVDGLSMEFGTWRFNVRRSNTEPVVRLNVESRGDYALMEEKRDLLLNMLEQS